MACQKFLKCKQVSRAGRVLPQSRVVLTLARMPHRSWKSPTGKNQTPRQGRRNSNCRAPDPSLPLGACWGCWGRGRSCHGCRGGAQSRRRARREGPRSGVCGQGALSQGIVASAAGESSHLARTEPQPWCNLSMGKSDCTSPCDADKARRPAPVALSLTASQHWNSPVLQLWTAARLTWRRQIPAGAGAKCCCALLCRFREFVHLATRGERDVRRALGLSESQAASGDSRAIDFPERIDNGAILPTPQMARARLECLLLLHTTSQTRMRLWYEYSGFPMRFHQRRQNNNMDRYIRCCCCVDGENEKMMRCAHPLPLFVCIQ